MTNKRKKHKSNIQTLIWLECICCSYWIIDYSSQYQVNRIQFFGSGKFHWIFPFFPILGHFWWFFKVERTEDAAAKHWKNRQKLRPRIGGKLKFFILLNLHSTDFTMYDFHDSTDTLKFWTEKWAISKTFSFSSYFD